jgi:hypothetical protein
LTYADPGHAPQLVVVLLDRRRRGFMLSTRISSARSGRQELAQTVGSALAGHNSGWAHDAGACGRDRPGKRVKDRRATCPPTLTANGKSIEPKMADKKSKASDRMEAGDEYKSPAGVPDGQGQLTCFLSEGVRDPDYKVGGDGLTAPHGVTSRAALGGSGTPQAGGPGPAWRSTSRTPRRSVSRTSRLRISRPRF